MTVNPDKLTLINLAQCEVKVTGDLSTHEPSCPSGLSYRLVPSASSGKPFLRLYRIHSDSTGLQSVSRLVGKLKPPRTGTWRYCPVEPKCHDEPDPRGFSRSGSSRKDELSREDEKKPLLPLKTTLRMRRRSARPEILAFTKRVS
jgi:hypothetical protein